MKTNPLSIIILDQHQVLGGTLGKSLKNRFGKRIRLRNYSDADSCIGQLVPDTQVFILDYANDANDPGNMRRWRLFNAVRWIHPQSAITMLRSPTGNIAVANEKMLEQISTFIEKKETQSEAWLSHLDRAAQTPFPFPVKKGRIRTRELQLFVLRVFLAIGIMTGIVVAGVALFY